MTSLERAEGWMESVAQGTHDLGNFNIDAIDHIQALIAELQRIRGITRDELSALIKNAYYHARDNGGTMHTAGDAAADAILELLHG